MFIRTVDRKYEGEFSLTKGRKFSIFSFGGINMRVDVYQTIQDLEKEKLPGADAVVIDVLRMTSTAVNALSNGAKRIRLVGDEEKARKLSRNENALLGGERGGVKLTGFDFGNSPLEYTKDKVQDQTIVMTTTNGARAAEAVAGAKSIRLCAFSNVSSVAESLSSCSRIMILCAGTHDRFSLDDCLCAGALCAYLRPDEENDLAVGMRLLYENCRENLHRALKNTKHYSYLESIGFSQDLEFCLKTNTRTCVPVMEADGWFRGK